MHPGRTYPQIPEEKEKQLRHAVRLELWTLFFLATIVAVMYIVMGSSQAMKTAWIEDLLSFLPPAMFVLTAWFERKAPNDKFSFGYHRVGSLGFFLAACALLVMGAYLLYESVTSLLAAEHPTIGTVELFGERVWLGWLMMAALAYSCIPPVILGRMKKKPSQELADKILNTDADMNAADWQTGVAGILGIAGIAIGWWWADALAAGVISFSVLKDGITNVRIALAELLDGVPRELSSDEIHPAAKAIRAELQRRHPGSEVRIRETGRYMRAVVVNSLESQTTGETRVQYGPGDDDWRLIEVAHSVDLGNAEKG
ncbi:MAG: cobalt transporter [Rhizobiales bacterium]|nr:cobalt transporter [Hyphomicrobiales bacterium]MBA67903.1 cobalt transporter [Hyphomicrobiales bacterium]|tara:strand:+ start:1017 stop:1958 length:942 start_codon:yes stop_codon:yes gene_type:complete